MARRATLVAPRPAAASTKVALQMDPIFPLSASDADVVVHALRYYAADVCEAFLEDDESPLLDDAAAAEDIARRLQVWLVANHQTLMRTVS